ncbi:MULTISPECIES: DNA ligase D [Sphingobacterium]|uniref:DNA ligase D n=1 Tax=Sphingobacterium TaxID=28453 RepID=UPI001053E26D|nr:MULTISPECIES: DNA ligase D [Sphingobacterium]MCW2259139.1 bifunctional non-homologous end joining protein LigD [Sphingobacterium kitahiroshimense]TCR14410.1 bifunctional non-homologous end joining protein LigD [Sphingobacterium sp. JUb78]
MTLDKYREKRSQKNTPEPFGGKSSGKELRFVVQKHAASHLHYDFRLEMDGVLKSWAVPKGPSLDADIKRLAMMVEDHPLDYRNFEGVIPKGQYGGGTVIVWDEGTYEPADSVGGDVKKQEKELLKQLKAGKLKFKLNGNKLKGEFALVKAYGKAENSWLLMKLDDKYASDKDITLKDKSVISKKSIAQMEKSPDRVYGQKTTQKSSSKDKPAGKKKASASIEEKLSTSDETEGDDIDLAMLLKKTPKKDFYEHVEPMLATLTDQPFDDDEWLYEVKWDGYRAVSFLNGNKTTEIKSRNDKSFNEKFYPIYEELKAMKLEAILDGEIVVVGENGHANFGALQNWRSEADGDLLYYVFDILWYKGKDLTKLTLTDRKAILHEILSTSETIKLSTPFYTSGIKFLETAREMGLEGIMAKRKDSAYHVHARTKDWLKIKANKRQEVVIGGFTKNDGSSKVFSSILVGVYEGKKLVYTGKVGTGFSDKLQKEMLEKFNQVTADKSPFSTEPDVNKASRFRPDPPHANVTWLKPKLICEVSFTEMTTDGVMRHPSFIGLREDKDPKSIVLEKEESTKKIVNDSKKNIIVAQGKMKRKTLLNPTEKTQVKKVNKQDLKFTNLDKIFWPDEKITKRDLINYYYQIAPYILPYLKDRPQSMNRFPDGIKGEGFYFKNVADSAPEWAETYLYKSETDQKDKLYLVGKDEATLLYMANLGCIEMNPWNSTVKKPDNPTFCIIDLDPDQNSFNQVIETAQVTKQLLDDMGVPSYCKTSGSTGLHIYIPLNNKYTYEQSKEFARVVVTLINRELPNFTSLERTVKNRKGRMYLDFLQNRPHATIASVYSVRPKPGATVSMPLYWEEVKKGLKMSDFTIFNAIERLESVGDIFKPVLGKGIDLKKVIDKYSAE